MAVELLPKNQWVAPSSVVLHDEGQNEDDVEKELEVRLGARKPVKRLF